MRPAPQLPIRLLALDIDGTLVGHDFQLSERTIAAIQGAVRLGVRVSLATGRTPSSAVTYANRLGLVEPIIGHQGGLVRAMPARREPWDPERQRFTGRVGRVLHQQGLAAAVVREVLVWCREHGLDPHLNDRERFIVWDQDPRFEDYSAFLGRAAVVVPDLEAAVDHPMSKVISSADPPLPMELYPIAKAHFAGRADATLSHPRFLEFVAPGVSKGRAVAWLANRAAIPMSQVMTIGDAFNDIEMIADAGHGTAMATAPAEVRMAARYIAPPVDEDGVAQLIEQLILAPADDAAANAVRLATHATHLRASVPR